MERVCGKCCKEVRDIEPAQCAFCAAFFHVKPECSDVSRSHMQQLFSCGKALWLCTSCRDVLGNRSLRDLLLTSQRDQSKEIAELREQVELLSTLVRDLQGTITSTVASCEDAIVSEIREGTSKCEKSIQNSVSTWPALTTDTNKNNNNKNNNNSNDNSNNKSQSRSNEWIKSVKPLIGGTRYLEGGDIIVAPPTSNKVFWIYLSHFHPSVKADTVSKLAKEALDCNDAVKVVPLVKNGADLNSFNYISFKVGINVEHREAALNPDSWPEGILFREFVDNRTKNAQAPASPGPSDGSDPDTP